MAKTRFLADWHSRFGLPRSQVTGLAEQATGREVGTMERLARGYDNEVYRVTLTGELVVYVRIRRDGEGTLGQEAWAMELARAGGVAVPDVLLINSSGENADGHPVMVVAAARGRRLEEVLATATDQDRHQLLTNVGHELARLHSIAMPGVWRPDEDGRWPDPVGLRAGFAAERRGEAAQLAAAGMTSAEVTRVMDLLEVSPDPPGTDFVLCHGDVSSEHIFVDSELQVSGLIDWGMWHAGSRTGELAGVAHSFGWNDLRPVLQGYGDGLTSNGDTLLRQLATTLAVQLIGHIAHDVAINDSDGAASDVAAVRQALRVLDETHIR